MLNSHTGLRSEVCRIHIPCLKELIDGMEFHLVVQEVKLSASVDLSVTFYPIPLHAPVNSLSSPESERATTETGLPRVSVHAAHWSPSATVHHCLKFVKFPSSLTGFLQAIHASRLRQQVLIFDLA